MNWQHGQTNQTEATQLRWCQGILQDSHDHYGQIKSSNDRQIDLQVQTATEIRMMRHVWDERSTRSWTLVLIVVTTNTET